MIRAFAAATLLASAAPLNAQAIRVRVIESETGRNISGAIVVLHDSAGRRLLQALSDDLGRITFQAPGPGAYRLKADRIGHPGVISPFFDITGDVTQIVEMPAERVVLPDVAVAASSVCGRREDSEETARLWEEVRKALVASQITASAETVELAVRRFVRYRTLAGTLRSDSTTRTFTTRLSPFVAVDPASLSDSGYIQGHNGAFRFLSPDAALLLSDAFLADHCLSITTEGRDAGTAVGLAFQPVKSRKLPDIAGVLWVDRATAELRSLEFEYQNVPAPIRVDGLGGRIDFERLGDGTWIIRDWYIRMPDRVAVSRTRGPVSQRYSVLGFVDDGGTARPLGDASISLAEAAPEVRRSSAVSYDLRAQVVSSGGLPIEAALVAVSGLDTVVRSDAAGRIHLSGLPEGRVRLRVRAVGHAPLAVEIALSGDRRLVDTTLTMKAVAQQLDSIVVNEGFVPFASNKMEGFERRRKAGFGRFLTMQELHDPLRGTLDLQLRRFPRINLARCGEVISAAAFGQQAPANSLATCEGRPVEVCFMSIYLDGALVYTPSMPGGPFDTRSVNLLTLQGVEVYRSPAELPVEYNATGSACGVILLWTR